MKFEKIKFSGGKKGKGKRKSYKIAFGRDNVYVINTVMNKIFTKIAQITNV